MPMNARSSAQNSLALCSKSKYSISRKGGSALNPNRVRCPLHGQPLLSIGQSEGREQGIKTECDNLNAIRPTIERKRLRPIL